MRPLDPSLDILRGISSSLPPDTVANIARHCRLGAKKP